MKQICSVLRRTASVRNKSRGWIQGGANEWRVPRQNALSWCFYRAPADCLLGSSPLWDGRRRIHFALGEWEINDPEMGLCEIRYEPRLGGLCWADSWLAGVNFHGGGGLSIIKPSLSLCHSKDTMKFEVKMLHVRGGGRSIGRLPQNHIKIVLSLIIRYFLRLKIITSHQILYFEISIGRKCHFIPEDNCYLISNVPNQPQAVIELN